MRHSRAEYAYEHFGRAARIHWVVLLAGGGGLVAAGEHQHLIAPLPMIISYACHLHY